MYTYISNSYSFAEKKLHNIYSGNIFERYKSKIKLLFLLKVHQNKIEIFISM